MRHTLFPLSGSFQPVHPLSSAEHDHGNSKADAFLQRQQEIHPGDRQLENKRPQQPQGNAEAPCADEVDEHDVFRPAAAAQNAAAEDHIQHLERRDQRIRKKQLPRHGFHRRVHLIDVHVDAAEQHHRDGEDPRAGCAVKQQPF